MEIDEANELPIVLTLQKFPFSEPFEEQFSKKFKVLKRIENDLPMNQFLKTEGKYVKALICGHSSATVEILNYLPSLGCVLTISAGVDHIDLNGCCRRGIIVGNAGNVYSENVADLAISLLIDVLRGISSADRFMIRAGLWPLKTEFPLGSKLGGKRVGIIGLGSIGSAVAKRLEAFGCVISYNSRKMKQSVMSPYYSNVIDLASNIDILILSCELNNETFHMINREVLLALGKKGVIINVGRGALIDEKELVRCLVDGEIAGAGLDVFEDEPYVPRELIELDNVVLSPHKAVLTAESRSDIQELVIANLEAFFSNKPLLSLVKLDPK